MWDGQQDGSVRSGLCETRVAAGSDFWLGQSAQLQVRAAMCGIWRAAALVMVSSEIVATAQSCLWWQIGSEKSCLCAVITRLHGGLSE